MYQQVQNQEDDWTGRDISEDTRSVTPSQRQDTEGQARAEVFCAASRLVRRVVRAVMRPRRGVSTCLTPTVPPAVRSASSETILRQIYSIFEG